MEGIMAVLADEQQAFLGTIGITSMSTARARLTGGVGIHFDSHTSPQQGFVGNHALQLSKAPFGIGSIGLPLLPARFFAFAPFGAFTDVCQIFQADKTGGVCIDDAFGDYVIGVGFQPSLSLANRHEATGSRASAFLLKTLSQSRIMIGFRN